jgi:hypothetical protein
MLISLNIDALNMNVVQARLFKSHSHLLLIS